jgi:hypothetical protein
VNEALRGGCVPRLGVMPQQNSLDSEVSVLDSPLGASFDPLAVVRGQFLRGDWAETLGLCPLQALGLYFSLFYVNPF